jgi:hypothetical protein
MSFLPKTLFRLVQNDADPAKGIGGLPILAPENSS